MCDGLETVALLVFVDDTKIWGVVLFLGLTQTNIPTHLIFGHEQRTTHAQIYFIGSVHVRRRLTYIVFDIVIRHCELFDCLSN